MKSRALMESILEEQFSFRARVNKCLEWLKEGDLSYIRVWGVDTTTGEGSIIRMWYNSQQDTYYGMTSSGELRKCKVFKMVYQHIIKDYFDTYDEEGIELYLPEGSTADSIYRHFYKGDLI